MIRLTFIIILFLLSLLSIFKAPAYYLWLFAIVVTELPWLLIVITLLSLVSGIWVNKHQLTGTVIGVLALLLYLSPIVRAYIVSSNLAKDFEAKIGPGSASLKDPEPSPYSFFNSFRKQEPVAYRTLKYVTYADTSMDMDFYPSQIAGKKPCVIVVHGGSWSSGDSKQIPELNSLLAQQGYHIAAINYRMAPKYQTPAPVEDIKNCLIYLRQHADELGIDTTKFVLLGRSAGAQIALLAAYTLHDPSIKAVIDFYGPADMVWGYSIPSNPLIMDSRGVMDRYIGGSYSQVPQKYVACSPLEFVDKNSPPTLIIHGANDVLVAYEHSRRLNEKLQQNGIKHFWLKLPWATHGFDFIQNGPGGQLANFTIERFLHNVTK